MGLTPWAHSNQAPLLWPQQKGPHGQQLGGGVTHPCRGGLSRAVRPQWGSNPSSLTAPPTGAPSLSREPWQGPSRPTALLRLRA
jgi:hypothetical protein